MVFENGDDEDAPYHHDPLDNNVWEHYKSTHPDYWYCEKCNSFYEADIWTNKVIASEEAQNEQ
ncbi:hypothetical protein [Planctobacterium marinum]|uniref:hypothetical protein n=1 Tax=Planctobacterium marinum TaxID=1631968 RepID=UPI001E3A20EE|nr:hypothetical protein [Planctobacterium marinum]MCC2604089.1 hypothetical protein [Planctobacterium marinum]